MNLFPFPLIRGRGKGDGGTAAGKIPRLTLRFRIMGDQLNMNGARILQMSLYETAANALPDPTTQKPVVSTRFGMDLSRMQDPVIGYMAHPNRDYWLLITDWEAMKGIKRIFNPSEYYFIVWVESTPALPVTDINGNIFDKTSYIYRAGIMPARSGNSDLNNGPSFEPDDVTTKVQDIYPDCDGVPNTDDEGDWGDISFQLNYDEQIEKMRMHAVSSIRIF
jgi:hypothetical protein